MEEKYEITEESRKHLLSRKLCSASEHAIIPHQDGMIKLDLPYFIVTASSNIASFRYDLNVHINVVTNEDIILSHGIGAKDKNRGQRMKWILIDHLLRCRGESVKIIVSDNFSVGKIWLTTVAMP